MTTIYLMRHSQAEKNIDYTPISHYGIGFLASFMLSDRVTAITSDWENQMQNIANIQRNNINNMTTQNPY